MKIIYDLILQKRSVFMLLFAFVLHSTGQAQDLWSKTYSDDRPVMYFSSIIYDDSVYRFAGGTRDRIGPSFTRAMLGKINLSGELTGYQVIYESALKYYGAFDNALITNNKHELFYTGYSVDSQYRLLIVKQNLLTDSIQTYEYTVPNTSAFQGYSILQYSDNSYYIAGVRTIESLNNANVVLLKIDSAGTLLWEKNYNQYKIDYASKIIKLANGNMMLGAVRNTADIMPIERANTWLLEVDTGGNVVRQWFDPNDSTYVAEGLLQTQDGGFVYGAQKKYLQSINSVYKVATICKLDANFNKQWSFSDGSYNTETGIYDIEELPDGSFIGCGNKPFYKGDSSMISGWVVKLSATGNVLWNRTYAGLATSFSYNYLSDIDVLPDGSLIAVGQCQHSGHTPPQVGWFLKLDSNGCEIENCVVGIEEPAPKSPKGDLNSLIQVWPNPFTSDISIALTGEHVANATYTITNLMGQVVYQRTETNLAAGYTKMMDLSYLPNGVYFVAVSTGERTMVERVVKE